MNWTVAVTAFGGALVEFVEAAIIVVAAAAVAGWRTAVGGTLAALAILAVASVFLPGRCMLGMACWRSRW